MATLPTDNQTQGPAVNQQRPPAPVQRQPQALVPQTNPDRARLDRMSGGYKTAFQAGGSLISAGMSLIGANLAQLTGNPAYAVAVTNLGRETQALMREKWQQAEANRFRETVGKEYQQVLKQAQDEAAASTEIKSIPIKDPADRAHWEENAPPGAYDKASNTLRAIEIPTKRADGTVDTRLVPSGSDEALAIIKGTNKKIFSMYQEATMKYLDQAARFPNNALITGSAEQMIQHISGSIKNLVQDPMKIIEERKAQFELESQAYQQRTRPTIEQQQRMNELSIQDTEAGIAAKRSTASTNAASIDLQRKQLALDERRLEAELGSSQPGGLFPAAPGGVNQSSGAPVSEDDVDQAGKIVQGIYTEIGKPANKYSDLAGNRVLLSQLQVVMAGDQAPGALSEHSLADRVRREISKKMDIPETEADVLMSRHSSPGIQALSRVSALRSNLQETEQRSVSNEEVERRYLESGGNVRATTKALLEDSPVSKIQNLELELEEVKAEASELGKYAGPLSTVLGVAVAGPAALKDTEKKKQARERKEFLDKRAGQLEKEIKALREDLDGKRLNQDGTKKSGKARKEAETRGKEAAKALIKGKGLLP